MTTRPAQQVEAFGYKFLLTKNVDFSDGCVLLQECTSYSMYDSNIRTKVRSAALRTGPLNADCMIVFPQTLMKNSGKILFKSSGETLQNYLAHVEQFSTFQNSPSSDNTEKKGFLMQQCIRISGCLPCNNQEDVIESSVQLLICGVPKCCQKGILRLLL